MQPQAGSDSKNIVLGAPDYSQFIKSQTNSVIIQAFLTELLSIKKFNLRAFLSLFRSMIIIMGVKMALEDSKSYLDNFKFSNTNFLKYTYQWLFYPEIEYSLIMIDGKWKHNGCNISTSTLTPFLGYKSIIISQPGTYYLPCKTYLIKVIIDQSQIIFKGPKLDPIIDYIQTEVIYKNREIMIGEKTIMSKLQCMQTGAVKLEPMQILHAFETDNYKKLELSIKQYFAYDKILKTSVTPFCVNFDGEPGTGKTTFGSYISNSGIFDRIIACNLVQVTNSSFQEFLQSLDRQITASCSKEKKDDMNADSILLILDEMDKWYESYESAQIHKFREESRRKKQVKDESGKETVIEGYEKLTPEEEADKRVQIRNEFLDQLYKLVEGLVLSQNRKYVIIFNTNHFDKIFENTDDKYKALYSRFQRYVFKKIGKQEIIAYISRIRDEFIRIHNNTEDDSKENLSPWCDFNEEIFGSIRDDINISYRDLHVIIRDGCYDINNIIEKLS